ncbi:Hypothetical protein SCLAV_p0197 (plasmid) [Streptomyces clavuligerus]|uniref:Uncharacterized protein n=1 Tax=Streptomyces clavuligerus TaxID=1901 RepID=B5GUH7_STRCL|nr:hypothetical protein SSCG_03227 [Streptomyces clavuligerus]EFG03688.1 Hypothetical protein SCLAV_p0197 [Streptomyces clavuligerus]
MTRWAWSGRRRPAVSRADVVTGTLEPELHPARAGQTATGTGLRPR